MSVATFAAVQLVRALPRTRISRAVGHLCEARLPAAVSEAMVKVYSRLYGIDLEEAAPSEGAYPSFDAFFTRTLRPGARPICTNRDEIASPADGNLQALGDIDAAGELSVKGRNYRVAELLGDETETSRYQGGQFAVIYLSPRDYHRVHAPTEGTITRIRSMPGDRYPVNALGERHVPSLFARNRRVAIIIDSAEIGRVTVVMVGAIIVGRITVTAIDALDVPVGVHSVDPPLHVSKGEEIGVFHLGSTAIVFIEPGKGARLRRPLGCVRLGQSLAEGP